MNLLLLGGTREARLLAERLAARAGLHATLSLAGATRRPMAAPLATRVGGFGGVDGLAAYLEHHAIDRVIDATHPFAATMSDHAAAACRRCGIALWRLERPPWRPGAQDDWIHVPDLAAAASCLDGLGSRVFLTVGARSLGPFADAPGRFWLVRSIDRPEPPPAFESWRLITARGPFTVADETELLALHAIDVLVTKNSGAPAMRAKLEAAQERGVRVVMVDRPALPAADAVFDSTEALWTALAEQTGHQ